MKYLFAFLFAFLWTASAVAQEATVEPRSALEPCSAQELEEINDAIDNAARQLSVVVFLDPAEHVYEITDDVTVQQRAYWDALRLQTDCVELYTRGYKFGRLLDEYSIAFGLASAYVAATAMSDPDTADRLEDQMYKHVRNAQRILQRNFPEYLELLGDERYQ